MQDFDDGDDNFMMNINMSSNGGSLSLKTDKKKEKKDKYLEKKMLQSKRKRDKNEEKNLQKRDMKNQAGDNQNSQANSGKAGGDNNSYKKNNFLNKAYQENNQITENNEETQENNYKENAKTYNQKPKFKKPENKFISQKENLSENKNKTENLQQTQPAPSNNQGDELIDELNEFYEAKEKNRFTQNTFASKGEKYKKKRELEKEIKEELRVISEENKQEEENKIKLENDKLISTTNANGNHTNNSGNSSHPNKDSVFSIKNFEDLEVNKYLKKALEKNNYTQMTKVQKKGIPILLKHKNVVVKSETGSGKTLAYVIPVFEYLSKLNEEKKIDRRDGVHVIIFAPTHELCLQIEETFNKLKSACINAVYGTLMGGQKIEREKQKLRKGLTIIISTPGRLLYHLRNTQNVKFDKLKMLIFDEADRLLDMGFERDIKECLSIVTKKVNFNEVDVDINNYDPEDKPKTKKDSDKENSENTTAMPKLDPEMFKKVKIFLISATIDYKIRKLAEFLMKGFKAVGFDLKNTNEEDEHVAAKGLNQYYAQVYDEFRLITLISFIRSHQDKKIIVFASTCDTVNLIYEMLSNIEIEKNIATIKTDNKENREKINNLNNFSNENNEEEGGNRFKNFNKKMALKRLAKSKEKQDKKNKMIDNNLFASKQEQAVNQDETQENQETNSSDELVKLFTSKFYSLHGKMDHNQRKTIFREFNTDKPGVLISTDVASRGLDFPMVDWIIHYDINPDPKEYLNRMGRSARLDQTGNSLLFLMEHEMPLLQTCFKPFSKDLKEMKMGSILLQFTNKINEEILTEKIKAEPEPYKDEVDQNEKFRKKYFFAIHPLQRIIKAYLFKNRDNLLYARKAFKGSVRSYATFMKFQKDVFNVKMLNLTRYARSFGLYKESTKIKIGDNEMLVDYQMEKNKTRGQKKFNNKKIERRLINSEFDN